MPWNDTAAFRSAPVRASSKAQQPPKQKPNVATLPGSSNAFDCASNCDSASFMRLRSSARSFFNGIIAAPASSALDGRTDCP
ncbi:hypothetical protein D3C81_2064490 [compost metagenome]